MHSFICNSQRQIKILSLKILSFNILSLNSLSLNILSFVWNEAYRVFSIRTRESAFYTN